MKTSGLMRIAAFNTLFGIPSGPGALQSPIFLQAHSSSSVVIIGIVSSSPLPMVTEKHAGCCGNSVVMIFRNITGHVICGDL